MIEINQRAKQGDPWDTSPLLTIPVFREALELGRLLQIFKCYNGQDWNPYDYVPASVTWNDEKILQYIGKPATYQIRAHAWDKVVVYQAYCRELGGGIERVRTVNTPSRTKLESVFADKLEEGLVITRINQPHWTMLSLTSAKEIVYDFF